MIKPQVDYAMLMASLPPHALSLWDDKNKSLSQVQLERHLTLLQPEDKQMLAKIESVLHWAKMPSIKEAKEIAKSSEQLLQSVQTPFLQEIIIWRLQIRTIIAAIRQRKLNGELAEKDEGIGYGDLPRIIKKNWQIDDFALSNRFPWVNEANQLFNSNECVALEKLLLNLSWRHYEKMGQGHYFDFEAVIIYVLRWDIINRWSQNDTEKAMQQFEHLVEVALGSESFIKMSE